MSNTLPCLYYKSTAFFKKGAGGGESGSRLSDQEDMTFWGGVCGDVIEPLSRICKQ
jgi:hypothetical protein